MIWATSDQHWSHRNIIKYCNRPFDFNAPDCVYRMNEMMISRWNEKIRPNDTVFFLGDMAFVKGAQYLDKIVIRLNGEIHWILGNHDDRRLVERVAKTCPHIVEVIDHTVLGDCLLVHYPVKESLLSEYDGVESLPFRIQRMKDKLLQQNNRIKRLQVQTGAKYVVHGHIHNSVKDNYPGHFNVSADVHDFYPVNFEDIVKNLEARNVI